MNIKIPVQNNVEIIIADIYVKCEIKLREQTPIRTNEGKLAFAEMQNRLSIVAYKMSDEILKNITN